MDDLARAEPLPRNAEELAALLARRGNGAGQRRIGLELEMGVLRREDLTPARYEGPHGIGPLLERVHAAGSFPERVEEAGNLIALKRSDGASLTLEPGGQLEISTAPHTDVSAIAADLEDQLRHIVPLAAEEGLRLLGGGLIPAAQEAMPWMPKARYRIMREYFRSLGEPGRRAHTMMQRSLSVQVTLDYADAAEACGMLRLAFLAAPITTAVFAASPFDDGREAGFRSLRAEAWRFTDPKRAGEIPACMTPQATLVDFAEYALDSPMMFRIAGGEHLAQHGASFREVLAAGAWPDGAAVTHADLWNHLGSIFTDARLKKGVIELRSTDGQAPADLFAIPALWVGLMYDEQARQAALDLLGGLALDAPRAALLESVPRDGLQARWGARTVQDLAQQLLDLAQAGLQRRVDAELEQPTVLDRLTPFRELVAQGRSPADGLLERWRGEWGQQLGPLVEHLSF